MIVLWIIIIVVVGLELYFWISDHYKKYRFNQLRKYLLERVIDECERDGGDKRFNLELPEYKELPDYNCELEINEYCFKQILFDGRTRKIYITEDGNNITKTEWEA